MDSATRAKLALALIAFILFMGSMWSGQDWLRWVAIGFLAAAVLLRFVYPRGGRRGDKGDTANVGVIALKPEWYELLARELTRDRVAEHFEGVIDGPVERYELPNLGALNFLLHGALDGGGTLSLKTDAQGKVFSTALLRLELRVPAAEVEQLGLPVEGD